MADYTEARIINGEVKFFNKVEKKKALTILRQGGSIYTNKSHAHTLAEALSDGQGSWKDHAHVLGGYKHYHDANRHFAGHIFYGEPSK